MAHIVEIYTESVYDNLSPLYPNWEPSRPVKLGDFGRLQGHVFLYEGNVSRFGIEFAVREADAQDHKNFASQGKTEVSFNAAGSVPVDGVQAKASLKIDFTAEDAVFFNAAGCSYSMIEDKVALGDRIMKLPDDAWKREWAIVTDLVQARSTTLAVSGARKASIEIEAAGDVPQIDLGDASIGLGVRSSRNVGYQLVAKQGLTPLFGLCKIQSRFLGLGGESFKPLAHRRLRTRAAVEDLEARERGDDALYFGQLK